MAKRKKIQSKNASAQTKPRDIDQHISALQRLAGHKTHVIKDIIPRIFRDYANDAALPQEVRTSTLLTVLNELSSCINNLTNKVPQRAPSLWKDRDKSKQEAPTEFFLRIYADFLGVTQADVRQLDFELYRALQNWKQRYGWPENFHLPTKRQSHDVLLSHYTGHELKTSTMTSAIAALRLGARLYEAARYRGRKKLK